MPNVCFSDEEKKFLEEALDKALQAIEKIMGINPTATEEEKPSGVLSPIE